MSKALSPINAAAEQIQDYVLDCILQGKARKEQLLPREVELASRFGVSRMNAHAAMKELERHGIVRRKRRVGTVVNMVPSQSLAMHLKGKSSRRVHILAGMELFPLHWSAATLGELDHLLAQQGLSTTHVPLPESFTRQSLETLLKAISGEGSAALLLMLPGSVSRFVQANNDLILRYHRRVYLFDRGDTPAGEWPFNVVTLDPFSEGVAAAEHLYNKGYRRFAFCAKNDETSYWRQQRTAGFELGLKRISDGSCDFQTHFTHTPGGLEAMSRWIKQADTTCAAACANDAFAVNFLELAASLGRNVPQDLGVIGFDNDPRCRSSNLTTLAPPMHRVAQVMAQVLTDRLMSDETFSSVVMRLSSEIIERQTTLEVSASVTESRPTKAKAGKTRTGRRSKVS